MKKEDIKEAIKLYEKAGINGEDTTFLFNDTQVIESSFLEDINGMLNSGEVSNLYAADELGNCNQSAATPDVAHAEATVSSPILAAPVDQAAKRLASDQASPASEKGEAWDDRRRRRAWRRRTPSPRRR